MFKAILMIFLHVSGGPEVEMRIQFPEEFRYVSDCNDFVELHKGAGEQFAKEAFITAFGPRVQVKHVETFCEKEKG